LFENDGRLIYEIKLKSRYGGKKFIEKIAAYLNVDQIGGAVCLPSF